MEKEKLIEGLNRVIALLRSRGASGKVRYVQEAIDQLKNESTPSESESESSVSESDTPKAENFETTHHFPYGPPSRFGSRNSELGSEDS